MLSRSSSRLTGLVSRCRHRALPSLVCPSVSRHASSSGTGGPDVTVVQEASVSGGAAEARPPRQLLFDRPLGDLSRVNLKFSAPREAWVDNWENTDRLDKRGLIQLHPQVFATYPRVDLIQEVVQWQRHYRDVDWTKMFTRGELPGMGPRPWPQKGTGRARHRDKRSPLWINGGWAHPPRGPRSKFYMPEWQVRVQALCATLSAKLAQNDIVFVDTIADFPHTEPDEIRGFLEARLIGPSALIVDVPDLFPRNLALAAERVKWINLMPVYGLNVMSLLKHETLVLTVAAVQLLEQRLLHAMHRTDGHKLNRTYVPPPVGVDRDPIMELPTTEYLTGDMEDLH